MTGKDRAALANRLAQYGSYVDPSEHERDCVEAARLISLSLDLVEKSKHMVELLDDAEINHGGLYSTVTLRGRNDLRLELSKWPK